MSHATTLPVSWQHAADMSVQLAYNIKAKVEEGQCLPYDRIVGIVRGGLHATNIVARILGMSIEQTLFVGVSRYDLDQTERPEGEIITGQIPARELVEGQRVLLIDDLVRTGETAAYAERILKNLGALEVDLAVLFDKTSNHEGARKPRFSVEKTDQWIEFIWQEFDRNELKNS